MIYAYSVFEKINFKKEDLKKRFEKINLEDSISNPNSNFLLNKSGVIGNLTKTENYSNIDYFPSISLSKYFSKISFTSSFYSLEKFLLLFLNTSMSSHIPVCIC
jgi:hypothetical protein